MNGRLGDVYLRRCRRRLGLVEPLATGLVLIGVVDTLDLAQAQMLAGIRQHCIAKSKRPFRDRRRDVSLG